MSNEIVYQVGGIAIILGGSIWGLKFLNNQNPNEKLFPSPEENYNAVEILKNDFEKQLKDSKETQLSLQEENLFLKNKTHHLDKQIISFQESLNAIVAEKNHLETQFGKDKLTIAELQKKLQTVEKLILPLLVNLMKNPEKEYIHWPNRVPLIEKQIERIVAITRG